MGWGFGGMGMWVSVVVFIEIPELIEISNIVSFKKIKSWH